MKKKIITVELADGLEARPAAMLVQVASQYDSRIYLESGSKRVNAKSIMGMMTLGLIQVSPSRWRLTAQMRIRQCLRSRSI